MVKRQYDWENGARIGPHSKIKLVQCCRLPD